MADAEFSASSGQGIASEAIVASDRVIAIIVTYHPNAEQVSRLIEAIRPQVARTIIIDNTPADDLSREAFAGAVLAEAITLHRLGRNVGLAAAQNLGIEQALGDGADFVVLFDQDSLPAPDMVAALLRAYRRLSAAGSRVGAVGPCWASGRLAFSRVRWGRLERRYCSRASTRIEHPTSDGAIGCDTLIASGCLIPAAVLRAVGPMDAALFIDQVDIEWSLRARHAGWQLFGVCDAVLDHRIGEDVRRIWFLGWRHLPVHAPVRNYYAVRNLIVVFFRRPTPWRWRSCFGMLLLVQLAANLTAPDDAILRRRLTWRGIRDGLAGRLGALADR